MAEQLQKWQHISKRELEDVFWLFLMATNKKGKYGIYICMQHAKACTTQTNCFTFHYVQFTLTFDREQKNRSSFLWKGLMPESTNSQSPLLMKSHRKYQGGPVVVNEAVS